MRVTQPDAMNCASGCWRDFPFGIIAYLEDLLPSFLPSFKDITLFRHFAPGPRPRHSMRPAAFKSRNRSRIMSRLTPGEARSMSVMPLAHAEPSRIATVSDTAPTRQELTAEG